MIRIVVMVEAIRMVVEVVMAEVTDLRGRMSALSVVGLDIGLAIAPQLVVLVVAAGNSPRVPGLLVLAVEIAMQSVTVMWMIDMMLGVLVRETGMTVEMLSMEAAVAMTTTGTHLLEEIVLGEIGMELQIVINHRHRAGMAGRETMTGMLPQGGAVTDTEVELVVQEDQHVMKEETTGTELLRMTVLEGEVADHLHLTINNHPRINKTFICLVDCFVVG